MPEESPTIRIATPDDYESVAQLIFRSHTISFAPFASEEWVSTRDLEAYRSRWQETLANAGADDTTYVALIDGEIVGSVRVAPGGSTEFDAQLTGMHVEPDLTGHGVGGLLMARALEFISERGFEGGELGVIAGNTGARRFYEAHGWTLVREMPNGIEGVPVVNYKLG
ncbi:MAG TPA: GNAT family N-acetyltransferase [Dehalococcoidia bacterium]|jgi:ribosomal protein S18 acetylase RimI-like enzyme|nr:GNAT family N-acetyltransferase [Dehalococcoidia bacterium]HIK88943.1 GNAT family N-acetyltransferase [Dehalococcoidia bacterium]